MGRALGITGGMVAVLLLSGLTQAQPWGGYAGGGPARMLPCGPLLMHEPTDVLGTQLGLSARQIQRIAAIRNDFFTRSAKLRNAMAQQRVELQALLRRDLPDERQVLQRSRKLQTLRSQLHERRLRAQQQLLRVLTRKQRTVARQQCAASNATTGDPGWSSPGWSCPRWGGQGQGRGAGWGRRAGAGRGRGWGAGWGRGWGGGW